MGLACKKYRLTIIFIIILLTSAHAQDNLIYFMPNIPQANYLNPSRITDQSKLTINLPILSGIDFTLNNSFSFHDLATVENNILTLDFEKFYSKISKNNYFSEYLTLPLLNVQYRTSKRVFSVGINEKELTRVGFDDNMILLANEGNYSWIGSKFLTNFDFNFLHYREYSLGYSQQVIEKLFVGARVKMLTGFSSVDVKQMQVSIETEDNFKSVRFSANGSYNQSLPSFNSPDGNSTENNGMNFGTYITNMSNIGFAFDIGMKYQLLPRLELSASLIDLGYIHWKSNPKNVTQKGGFTWQGFDLSNITNTRFNEKPYENPISSIIDSLSGLMNPKTEESPFNTTTPAKIYIGGNYKVTDFFNAGIVDRIMFYDKQVSNSITLSGNLCLGRIFTLSAGYSIIDKSFDNLALGTALKLGPIEVYFITGNILALNILDARNFNVRFGLNLMIGRIAGEQYTN